MRPRLFSGSTDNTKDFCMFSPSRTGRLAAVSLAAGLLVSILPHTSAQADSNNLVTNASFSSGTAGWKVTDPSVSTLASTQVSSNAAALLRATKANATVSLNDVTNTVTSGKAGVTYVATARVKSNQAKLNGQLRVREVAGGKVTTHASTFYNTTTNWQEVTLTFTTTKDAGALDLNVLAWKVSPGRDFIVDDVTLRVKAATTPTPTPVTPTPTSGYTLSDGCHLNARGVGKCDPLVGAAHGSNTDPSSLAKSLGQRLGVRRTYWNGAQVDKAVAVAKADVAAGRIPWISFKLPYSWADMASGKGDAWTKDLTAKLAQVDGPVWLAFHHEPEGDGVTADWKKMQERLGPIVRSGASNVAFTVVLTGWNQWYGSSEYRIENIWPNTTVDIAGFDIYSFYGTWKNGKYRTGSPSLKTDYFDKIAAWAKTKNVAWGLAETGLTDAASKDNPHWLATTYRELKATDAIAMTYFDTLLNTDDSYNLSGGQKNIDFADALKLSPEFPMLTAK